MALILDGNGLIQGLDAGGLPSGSVNADSLASTLDLSSKTMTFGNVSASGITFPATQSASSNANTLDDYEEGTFTPTIVGTSSAGTGTYSKQTGTYTKIGNRVYFSIYIIWSAHTGTGDMNIGGLPFTSNSSNFSPCANRPSNLTLTANHLLVPWVVDNSTTVSLQQYVVGGGAVAAVAIDTSAEIAVSGHYFV